MGSTVLYGINTHRRLPSLPDCGLASQHLLAVTVVRSPTDKASSPSCPLHLPPVLLHGQTGARVDREAAHTPGRSLHGVAPSRGRVHTTGLRVLGVRQVVALAVSLLVGVVVVVGQPGPGLVASQAH